MARTTTEATLRGCGPTATRRGALTAARLDEATHGVDRFIIFAENDIVIMWRGGNGERREEEKEKK